jgi:hypothetical protein
VQAAVYTQRERERERERERIRPIDKAGADPTKSSSPSYQGKPKVEQSQVRWGVSSARLDIGPDR